MASGLDTTGVISALTGAENNQIENSVVREGGLKEKLNAWQQFNSLLTSLQAATNDLSTAATYKGVAATSSTPATATVTSSTGAAAGTHALSVTALAQNHQVLSDSQQDPVDAADLTGFLHRQWRQGERHAGRQLERRCGGDQQRERRGDGEDPDDFFRERLAQPIGQSKRDGQLDCGNGH